MGLFASVRQSWLRRNTLFFASVFGAALVTELAMDSGIEKYWEIHNKGVIIVVVVFIIIVLSCRNCGKM